MNKGNQSKQSSPPEVLVSILEKLVEPFKDFVEEPKPKKKRIKKKTARAST